MVQTWPGVSESSALALWAKPDETVIADPDAARRLRTDRGLNTASVCEAAGLSAGALHRFERGLSRPRKATVRALARVYGVPPRALRLAWQQTRAATAERLAQKKHERRHPASRAMRREVLTIVEASRFFRTSVDQIARWTEAGRLSPEKHSDGQRRYRQSELQRLLEDADIPDR